MRSSRFLMISAMCLLVGAGSALAQGRPVDAYLNIDPPGATTATAYGINAQGNIVGQYTDSGNVTHGFLLTADGYRTVDYPGAKGTDARAISETGEIVGNYWPVSGDVALPVGIHGYLLTTDGVFTAPGSFDGSLEQPHSHSIAQRILPDGMILGCIHDANMTTTMKGLITGNGVYEERDAMGSMDNGATPDLGMIVGSYMDGTVTKGYTVIDGVFTPFVITVEGTNLTQAWDVNPKGEIVGVYRVGAVAHGYLLRANALTLIDYPGASQTRAFGVNALGNVVGSYVSGGVTHAFLLLR